MKINHIAIWTSDLEKMKAFYLEYFEGTASDKYTNEKKGFESYFVSFESGAKIELMRKRELIQKRKEENTFGIAHIAFSVGSREKVTALTERLREAGYTVQSKPRTTGDGYFESCILDPEENVVEITV